MSDFSDRPFAAGSVFGLRVFRPDAGDHLIGVRGNPWVQGENVAKCLATDGDRFMNRLSATVWPPSPTPPEGHRAGIKDCSCGYYAYFDGSNDAGFSWPIRIPAVIEGYGVVTIGTRGFRCEKARIVAFTRTTAGCDCCSDPDLTKHYPNIPIYDTEADMLAAHPISKPEGLRHHTETTGRRRGPCRRSHPSSRR